MSGAADRAARPAREARVSALVAVLALVAGLAVAPPWQDPSDIPEGFAGRLVAGVLERLADDAWVTVHEGELVPDGARVRSTTEAELAVPGGRIMLRERSRVVLDDPVLLEGGALLTSVDADRRVRLGSLVVTGRGAWRVDASPTERVGVYSGQAGVHPFDAAGGGLDVGRLQQADVSASRLPDRALPLRYASTDPWDARWLAAAVAVDREIERLERSLLTEYGADPRPAGFYVAFAALDADVVSALHEPLGDGRGMLGPVGAVLVHATVAGLVAERLGVEVGAAIEATVGLRRDGATWGLVLVLHDLGPGEFLDAFDQTLEAAAGLPAPPPTTADDDGPVDGEPQTGAQPPGSPAPQPPPDDDEQGPVDDVGDAVDEVADDVEDAVDDAADDLGDAVDDAVEEVGGVVDDVTDLLDGASGAVLEPIGQILP